jgi:formate hydrogenlyase subunit 6/NADH:ubiquinone oxidoreductase subunit I
MMAERNMPKIDEALCTLCGDCVPACPRSALSISPQAKIQLDGERCAYCGDCEDVCPVGAIALPYEIVLAIHNDDQGG